MNTFLDKYNPINRLVFYGDDYIDKHIEDIEFLDLPNNKKLSFIVIKLKKAKKYMIWSHSNATNIFTMYTYLKFLTFLLKINIICYDYQGYGLSTGKCTEYTCYYNHECIINYAINTLKIDEKNIILTGHSLGTGVVIDYAVKNNWKHPIILISPYKSILSIVNDKIPYIYMIKPCINFINMFKNNKKIKNLHCPVKIIHSLNDSIIPIKQSHKLYKDLNCKLFKLSTILDGNHNDIFFYLKYCHFKECVEYYHL